MAFAEYYWDVSGRALQSGMTEELKALSTDCVPCDEYVRLIDADAKKGRHADINPSQVTSAKITDQTDGKSDKAVTLAVEDKAYKVVDSQGQTHGRAKAVDYDVIIYLDWKDSGWTVVDDFVLT